MATTSGEPIRRAAGPSTAEAETRMAQTGRNAIDRPEVEASISIRTILLVAATVAVAWALVSVTDVLLMIFVSVFSVAVLLPVVNVMERRFGNST